MQSRSLTEQTRHHHEEEEENLFPKVRKLCSAEELTTLGQALADWQGSLVRQGEERAAIVDETDEAAPLK